MLKELNILAHIQRRFALYYAIALQCDVLQIRLGFMIVAINKDITSGLLFKGLPLRMEEVLLKVETATQ